MSKHSEEMLDDLTDAEREAIESYDAEQEAEQAANPDAAPEPVVPDEPEATPDATPAPEAEPTAEPAAPAAEPEPVPEPAKVEKPEPVSAPLLVVNAPEDAPAKLADISAKKGALVEEFENGDVTTAQFHAKMDALNEEQFEIKSQVREFEMATKMEEQRIQSLWKQDVTRFLNSHDEYSDPERLGQLDQTIMALARMPVNAGLANDEALKKAHKMVRAMRGEPADDVPAATTPAKPTQQKVPKPDAPPNIGNLPSATMNDTSGGEFASLDRLQSSDPIAYEEKLMGMSPAQRERYLKN